MVLFLLSSVLFGIFALFILLNTDALNTPKELLQAREIENFKLQYELLNKKLDKIEEVMVNVADRDNNLYRVYFEASPIPEEQRKMGFGGINRYKELEGYVWMKDKQGNTLQKPNPLTGDHAIDAARYVMMMVLENPNRGKYYLY